MIQIIKLKRDIARAEVRLQVQKAVIKSRYARLSGEVLSRLSSPTALVASFVCGFCLARIAKVPLTAGGLVKSSLSSAAYKGVSAFVLPVLYSVIKDSIDGTSRAVDSHLE